MAEKAEPVLLVPPRLTQSAYALLVRHHLVARKWHLEGRYGSRTFRPGPTDDRMGLPLLSCAAKRIEEGRSSGYRCFDAEMRDLLLTPRVDLIRGSVPHPKNAPKVQHTDATVHPELRPSSAPPPTLRRVPRPTRKGAPSPASEFTFIELFSGIGGFGLALEALGGRCLFASEINEHCNNIYLDNLTHPPRDGVHGDIYEVPDSALPKAGECDLLVAGFPCQPFSRLGAQPGFKDGERGLLYTQIVRALRVSRPRGFLLENVQGLAEMGDSLNEIVASLREVGYRVSTEVVTARGLTAQSRKRLFFVGLLRDQDDTGQRGSPSAFEFPFIPDLGLRARDILERDDGGAAEDFDTYRLSPAQMDQLLHRSKKWKPSKLAWADKVLDTLDGHYGNSIGKGHSQLVPCAAPRPPRLFTPRECARVQGFPNWFALPPASRAEAREDDGGAGVRHRAHRKRLYLMFGNAVCPPVIAALAGAVLAACRGDGGPATDETRKRKRRERDWRRVGLDMAVSLALESVAEERREKILDRLVKSKQVVVS